MSRPLVTVDGNEATAWVAHRLSEVIATERAVGIMLVKEMIGTLALDEAARRPSAWA